MAKKSTTATLLFIALSLASVAAADTPKAPKPKPKKDIPTIYSEAKGALVDIIMSRGNQKIAYASGFVATPDGAIVTNYHVIAEGTSAVVKFADGTVIPVDGVLVFSKMYDLAVIKVHGKTFQSLTLGDSDQAQIGQDVVAIGDPLGYERTVSNGLLSGFRSDGDFGISTSDYDMRQGHKMFQITAPISHGSSGSPLFNMYGEVIGVNAAGSKAYGGENLNFAIPINPVKIALLHLAPEPQKFPEELKLEKEAMERQSDIQTTMLWVQTTLPDGGGFIGVRSMDQSLKLDSFSGCQASLIWDSTTHGNAGDNHMIETFSFNFGDLDLYRLFYRRATKYFGKYADEIELHTKDNATIGFESHSTLTITVPPSPGVQSSTNAGRANTFEIYVKPEYTPQLVKAINHLMELCQNPN
jgi:hypothetical protein